MIRFTCLCQNRIEADDDMAGGLTQCPRCGRLNDVPTLSDLPYLADDGTYRVDVERPRDDPLRLAELSIVYSKGTTDTDGDVIDMRMASADLALEPDATPAPQPTDADGAIPLKDEPARRPAPVPRAAPRYDPESGELIVPMELAPHPDRPDNPAAIPVARAAISYATGEAAYRVTTGRVAIELLMPVNVAVMSFIFITHVLLQFSGTVAVNRLYIFAVIPIVLAIAILSHYGNVIDETGPQERDEVPRPLRSVELYEDIWQPFVNVLCALSICFAPALLVLIYLRGRLDPPVVLSIAGAALAVGIGLLPAVLLTTCSSGTVINLRPDRVFGMIRACGSGYALAAVLGALAMITYGFGMFAADVAFIRVLAGVQSPLPVWVHLVGYPMLALGIYCAHLFCWHLGHLYREYHAHFPWAFQRHVRDPMKDVPARLRRGSLGDVAASAGPTGAAPPPAQSRKDTRTKLRELRDLERRRKGQRQSLTGDAR